MPSVLVLGATGAAGREVVKALRARDASVVAASRDTSRVEAVHPDPDVAKTAFDPGDERALLQASDGCHAIINCTGPSGFDHSMLERLTKSLCSAIGEGLRVVHISSAWSYTPLAQRVLRASHPRCGGPAFLRSRRRSEDEIAGAGGTVLQLPDFFGPAVRVSPLQFALRRVVDRRAFDWIAPVDVPREYLYLADGAMAAALLVDVTAAAGSTLIMPGSGPLSLIDLDEIVQALGWPGVPGLGFSGKTSSDPGAAFGAELGEMANEYRKPVEYDGSELRQRLCALRTTDYKDAIDRTLTWLSEEAH